MSPRQTVPAVHLPAWKAAALARLRAEVARLDPSVPAQTGGWMHDFTCPEHLSFLAYDPQARGEHRCPAGHTVSGAAIQGGWRVLRHRELADGAAGAALLYTLGGDPAALDKARAVLLDYARRYADYQGASEAQPWMLKGQVFQQALTEGLWMTPLARAAWLLRPALGRADWQGLEAGLLRPAQALLEAAAHELVGPQGKRRSNYLAWLLAALGGVQLALGDRPGLETTLDELEAHLAVAVLGDGFQWEGSPYYHTFVTLAYSLLIETAEAAGLPAYARFSPVLRQLWEVIPDTLWDSGEAMQRRDGSYWPNGPARRELGETLELAWARTRDVRYAHALRRVGGAQARSWVALLYGAALPGEPAEGRPGIGAGLRPSRLFAESGLAVLRGAVGPDGQRTELTLEFGAHGGEHGHYDLLSLHLVRGRVQSHDPGSPPYGHAIRRDFYQQTAAHNTVVVDGRSQQASRGTLLHFSPQGVAAQTGGAYPGVELRREVWLDGPDVHDHFSARAPTPHVYDWLFHGRGTLRGEVAWQAALPQPASPESGPDSPYRFLRFLRASAPGQEPFEVTFCHQGTHLTLRGEVDQPYQLIEAAAPGDDAAPWLARTVLIVRVVGRALDLRARWQPRDATIGP